MDDQKIHINNNTTFIDMDASTQTWHKPVESLFCLVLDYVVENMNFFINENEEKISALPFHVKNRMLRKFTISAHFWKKVDFKTVLVTLVNEQTHYINLTSADVDDDILKVLQKCINIRKLYLSRTKDIKISTKGLINLLKNCHSLTHLFLAHSNIVDDDVLECMADNCPNLMGLDIGGSTYVTDLGVTKISKLKHLSWITLSSTQISDEGIIHLVQGPCKLKLKEMRIENTKVTDVGLKEIAENCPNLEILSFYSRRKRDDVSCPMFSSELKNLKQLTWTVNW